MPTEDLDIDWRRLVTDAELDELTASHDGSTEPGWWDRVRDHSLGWVTARTESGQLVGFVNVAWDGGDHAFLLDTKTRSNHQRQGLGTAVVQRAVEGTRAGGCEWLFVDYQPHLEQFYVGSCGFRPTAAGLVHLTDA